MGDRAASLGRMDHDLEEAPAPAGSAFIPILEASAADEVQRHAESLATMDRLIEEARELGTLAILNHLQRARLDLRKNAHGAQQSDARVAAAMRQVEIDRQVEVRERRCEAAACSRLVARSRKEKDELALLADELRQEQAKLRDKEREVVRQEVLAHSRLKKSESVRQRTVVLQSVSKDFDDGMFGAAKINGGGKEHRNHHLDCPERIKRSAPELPPELEVNWERMKASFAVRLKCFQYCPARYNTMRF